jgi:hypothetical protein
MPVAKKTKDGKTAAVTIELILFQGHTYFMLIHGIVTFQYVELDEQHAKKVRDKFGIDIQKRNVL